jgi:hypothetical protein
MLGPMVHSTRLQPVKAAALVAAVMLLSMALSASAGAAAGTPHRFTGAALTLTRSSASVPCAQAASRPEPCTACGTLAMRAANAPTPASFRAGWRLLNLPPPAR